MRACLALLAGGYLACANPAAAQVEMFNILTTQPGQMDFKGVGTANYNNSSGTGNSITLGSSSGISVNGSVSASNDYLGSSTSYFQLGSNTNFQQTIGTSSQAANMQATAQASAASASSTAQSVAERQVKAELGYSYNDYLDKYNASAATNAGTSLIAGTIDSSGVSTAYDQTQWGDAIENRQAALYNDAYATAYSSANQSSSTSGSQSGNSGIVTANFKTINQGEASTQDKISTFTDTALAAARGQHGESWTANPDGSTKTVNGVSYAVNTSNQTESEWNESFNNTLSDTLANSIQAAQSTSTSESTVEGIGNIANVTSSAASHFSVELAARLPGNISPDSGSANGSAGANVNTSSNVAVNNTQFASAFIQAFAPQ
jgi:hypothetical protein